MDTQKQRLLRNTLRFVNGRPANNALLWGARGTGKSTLIRALLHRFSGDGLRLIEVSQGDLLHLPEIVDPLYDRPERFIIYCDDLSFSADDAAYTALKAMLDGSVQAIPDHLLIYATSNRRHLMPEYHTENQEARVVDGELHPGEAVEEKVSLSDRFGLWIAFRPFNQEQYLCIARHWLQRLGVPASEDADQAALRWALARGSRSGRTAWQFARDYAGGRG